MRRVFFSDQAIADLVGIGSYIEQFNPARSETFVTELRAKGNNIAHFPHAYPSRYDLRVGLRMALHGHYKIFFHATDLEVEIIRIIHGARDLREVFGDG